MKKPIRLFDSSAKSLEPTVAGKAEFDQGAASSKAPEETISAEATGPDWRSEAGVLTLDGVLIKEFANEAEYERLVLDVFQKTGWTRHVKIRLEGEELSISKKQLQNAVRELNRGQPVQKIRFRMDGTGQGVRWERVPSESPRA